MKNLREIYKALRDLANENYKSEYSSELEDAVEALEAIRKTFIGVHKIQGTFDEVYPSLSYVFSSLPWTSEVEDALASRDFVSLNEWYEDQKEKRPGEVHHPCDMEIGDNNIVFYTGTSGRKVVVGFDRTVYCEFYGSIRAAREVIEQVRESHPDTSATFDTVRGDTYDISSVDLDKGVLYHTMPEWMKG